MARSPGCGLTGVTCPHCHRCSPYLCTLRPVLNLFGNSRPNTAPSALPNSHEQHISIVISVLVRGNSCLWSDQFSFKPLCPPPDTNERLHHCNVSGPTLHVCTRLTVKQPIRPAVLNSLVATCSLDTNGPAVIRASLSIENDALSLLSSLERMSIALVASHVNRVPNRRLNVTFNIHVLNALLAGDNAYSSTIQRHPE